MNYNTFFKVEKKDRKSSQLRTRELTMAAILCAVGIIIPLFSPIKILLEPASFTLASHVAIYIAMFLSPTIGITVAIGTTIGFFLGGFPLVVVARAASHLMFVAIGSLVLRNKPQILSKTGSFLFFVLWTSVLHAVGEMLVVFPFYVSNAMTSAYYEKGYVVSIFLLVGLGTLIHSMVDYGIALIIWKAVNRNTKRDSDRFSPR